MRTGTHLLAQLVAVRGGVVGNQEKGGCCFVWQVWTPRCSRGRRRTTSTSVVDARGGTSVGYYVGKVECLGKSKQGTQAGSVWPSSRSPQIRGDTEDFFTFKLSTEKKCFLRPLVSAEVSLHTLASMIEKLHTQSNQLDHPLAIYHLQ